MQQINWHKSDVPVWGATFAAGLIAAIAFLAQAALSPKAANPIWVLLCSIYASIGTVIATRCRTLLLLDAQTFVRYLPEP